MSDFKRLIVWRKSHALALAIHRAAARIRGVMYSSLRSQMVRAALSIPANIVEGRGQRSDREFARYPASFQAIGWHLAVRSSQSADRT
jgi:23S rRNA-intervening sequence protein